MTDDRFEKELKPVHLPNASDMAQRREVNVVGSRRAEEVERLKAELAELKEQLASRPAQSIIPVDGVIHAGPFQMSMLALLASEDVTQDELVLFADFLKAVISAYQFWAGDLAILCEQRGVSYDSLATYLEVDLDTVKKWARVCDTIPARMRVQALDYTHHLEVANKADKLGDRVGDVLEYAKKYDLSTRDLQAYIRQVIRGGKPVRRIPADTLFSKDRTPGLVEMRKDYMAARRGDKASLQKMREHLTTYRKWLQDVEEILGLR